MKVEVERSDDMPAANMDCCTEPWPGISNLPDHSAETSQTSPTSVSTLIIPDLVTGLPQTDNCNKREPENCFTWGDFVTGWVSSRQGQEDVTMCSLSNTTLNCNNVPKGQTYWVSFEEKSFSRGQHFKVYSGRINGDGPRSRDWCVVKVFTSAAGTEKMCAHEAEKSQTAQNLARDFNTWLPTDDTRVKFSYIFWAPMDEVSWVKQVFFSGKRRLSVKDMVLIEDDLRYDEERPGKQKELTMYMDSQGRKATCIAKDLEAFAHFTYHHSAGQLVVCDFEGVQDDEGFYLKTPVIHSREKKYGNSDMGVQGIVDVFNNHVCNKLCKDLIKPCEILDNFRVFNADSGQDVHSTSTISCGNNHTCPEYRQVVSQDSCNNNCFFPQSYSTSPSCAYSGSNVSSRCFSCSGLTSGHVEPSAPPEEDCIYDQSLSWAPQTRHNFVASWILQEQVPNNFIASRLFYPSQHPTACGSLDNSTNVTQIMPGVPSRTDSNSGNSSLPGPSCHCLKDNPGTSGRTGDQCHNDHAGANVSTGFWSNPSSSTAISTGTSGWCNSCRMTSPLTQNPTIESRFKDSQVLDSGCLHYVNVADRTTVVSGTVTNQHVCHKCASNLIDSPPPYVQTQ